MKYGDVQKAVGFSPGYINVLFPFFVRVSFKEKNFSPTGDFFARAL